MQIVVPNNQLGRVGGGIGTISETANLGSMALAGVLASLIGIPLIFLIEGVMCILGGCVALLGLPSLTLKDMPVEPLSATFDSGVQLAEVA